MKMRLISLLFAISLMLAACGPSASSANSPKTPQALQLTPGKGVLINVFKPDGSTVGLTYDDLKKMPLADITVEGMVEEGPKLSDVLKAAGVTDFSEISLSGSASPVTITKAQVDDNTILDFNNHGTVKFASTYIPKPQWTKDVSEIRVK